MAASSVERLVEKLRAAGVDIPDGYEFHRTYAGARQREAGAWSWFIVVDGRDVCGSVWSVKQLLSVPIEANQDKWIGVGWTRDTHIDIADR